MAEIPKQQPLPDDPFQHEWQFGDEAEKANFLASEKGKAAEFIREYPKLNIAASFGFPDDSHRNTNKVLGNLPESPIFYLLDPEKFGALFCYAIALSRIQSKHGADTNPLFEGVNKMLAPIFGWLDLAEINAELTKETDDLKKKMFDELTLSGDVFKNDPRMMLLLNTKKEKMLGKISDPLWEEVWSDSNIQDRVLGLVKEFIKPFLETLAEERLQLATKVPFSDLQFFVPERTTLQIGECLKEIAKNCAPATILTFENDELVHPATQESIHGTTVRVMTTHDPAEAHAKVLESFQSIDGGENSEKKLFAERLRLEQRTSPGKSAQ
jgi:hypothetical protein